MKCFVILCIAVLFCVVTRCMETHDVNTTKDASDVPVPNGTDAVDLLFFPTFDGLDAVKYEEGRRTYRHFYAISLYSRGSSMSTGKKLLALVLRWNKCLTCILKTTVTSPSSLAYGVIYVRDNITQTWRNYRPFFLCSLLFAKLFRQGSRKFTPSQRKFFNWNL